MYVCLCNAITESQVQDAINEGACDLACLRSELGIASQCGRCAETASKMLSTSTLVSTPQYSELPRLQKG
jgi:bacterioferritin-associated ferredoxin